MRDGQQQRWQGPHRQCRGRWGRGPFACLVAIRRLICRGMAMHVLQAISASREVRLAGLGRWSAHCSPTHEPREKDILLEACSSLKRLQKPAFLVLLEGREQGCTRGSLAASNIATRSRDELSHSHSSPFHFSCQV